MHGLLNNSRDRLSAIRRLLHGWRLSSSISVVPVHTILAAIDSEIAGTTSTRHVLAILDKWKRPLCRSLKGSVDPLAAKALTIKLLNLFLSKFHFLARSTSLLSSPYGIVADPTNACQLACPGCVHSTRSKELKLFDWGPGILSESMFADFMRRYGPYAIEIVFYNYGEPLLNPNTPKLIRIAKTHLARTMLSTNMNAKHFDPEAYVSNGLDYMTISIDGATQNTYEKFRHKGDIEAVFNNVRRLVQTRKRMGKRTPLISWQYLAFEHNEHEIDVAIQMARSLEVDQFVLASPFDVSWDDPLVRPSKQKSRAVLLRAQAEQPAIENWNPFPSEMDAELIEHEFAARWRDRLDPSNDAENLDIHGNTQHTCHYLYKNIVMDARGRILPCCGAPGPGVDLVYGNVQTGGNLYNSEKFRLARLSFANPQRYRSEQPAPVHERPFCAKCQWKSNQNRAQIDNENLKTYFAAVGGDVFNPASVAVLSSW